jgi:glyoxylase-like metal-dependent hydrolase (beta-lactamase superfamily II)
MPAEYDVIAIRYATRMTTRGESFYRYHVYGEPDRPLQLDFYFWLLRGPDQVILVDTGVHPAAERPGRQLLIRPADAVAALGVAADDVSQVVVTHCHSDHIGNLDAFARAKLTVQRREIDFWSGSIARRRQFAATVDPGQIKYLRGAIDSGRGVVIDGDTSVADGVEVRLVGGHCPGQQIVIVRTSGAPVVLPSDAVHFYEELDRQMPFGVLWNLGEMYAAYDLLQSLATAGAVVVPGHDPEVMRRFSAMGAGLELMARLF